MSEWEDVEMPGLQDEWEDVQPAKAEAPKESIAETAIMGTLQGLTGGFSDEIAGGLEAAGRAAGIKGMGGSFSDLGLSEEGPTLQMDVLKRAYENARERKRGLLSKQAKDNPGTAFTTTLAGGALSPINKLAKGMSLAKGGAALGGLNAAGYSEADSPVGLTKDVAIGAAGGALLGKGAEKVGQKLSNMTSKVAQSISPPKQKANAEEIRKAADAMGIKLTPGMLDDSGFVERLESSLAKSPSYFGQRVKRSQDAVAEKLREGTESLLSEASDLSPYQLGDEFKSRLTAKVGERLDPISALFDDVAESTKSIPIGDRSKEAIMRNIGNLDVMRLTGGTGKPQQYVDMIGRLQNANDAKILMTLLNKDIASAQGAERQVLLAIKDKVANLEKNSIMRGAIAMAKENRLPAKQGKSIGGDVVSDLIEARKGYRGLAEDLNAISETSRTKFSGPASFLDKVEQIPSERVSEKFMNLKNNRQVRALAEKFPEEFQLLRQGKLGEILSKSTDNSLAGQGKLSTQRFLNEFRKLSPEAQQDLFGSGLGQIKNIETLQQSLPRNFNPSGTASELGWQDAIARNIKDIPTFALYKAASSNLADDVSKGLGRVSNIRNVYESRPELYQTAATQLQQGVGLLSTPSSQMTPRFASDEQAMAEQLRQSPRFARMEKENPSAFQNLVKNMTKKQTAPVSQVEARDQFLSGN